MSQPRGERTESDARLRAAISDIAAHARTTNQARAEHLAATLAQLDDGEIDPERRATAVRTAHQLAGSAGTFGFDQASRLAVRLERYLLDGPLDDRDRLREAHRQLRELRQVLQTEGEALDDL